jgi:hypothetical protein
MLFTPAPAGSTPGSAGDRGQANVDGRQAQGGIFITVQCLMELLMVVRIFLEESFLQLPGVMRYDN